VEPKILCGKAVLAAFPFGFPAPRTAAVDDRISVKGLSSRVLRWKHARIQALKHGNQGIFTRPKGGVEALKFAFIAVQRCRGFDFAGIKIDIQNEGSGKSQIDNFLKENGGNFLCPLCGKDPQGGGFLGRPA
jgi:hypothetical protein